MKILAWLILSALVVGCDIPSITDTVTKDGKKALLVESEGRDIQCLTMAGQKCPYGYEVVTKETYFYNDKCKIMVACHDKFSQ